jgi:hypothetical protein
VRCRAGRLVKVIEGEGSVGGVGRAVHREIDLSRALRADADRYQPASGAGAAVFGNEWKTEILPRATDAALRPGLS